MPKAAAAKAKQRATALIAKEKVATAELKEVKTQLSQKERICVRCEKIKRDRKGHPTEPLCAAYSKAWDSGEHDIDTHHKQAPYYLIAHTITSIMV